VPDAGALASLNYGFAMFAVGMVMDPQMGAAVAKHNEVVKEAFAPWDAGVKYGNFTEAPTDPRMCFPPETFERLQQVKLDYDPDDLFRANHPIPCAAAV
jgi:hypothetical protein